MRILELGNYIIPAYAGMLLAEQGHNVDKWTNGRDPILALNRGQELWRWINAGKLLFERDWQTLLLQPDSFWSGYDVVIDNVRPTTLKLLGINPEELASKHGLRWVSMRSESADEVSFDVLAQARAWMEFCPWVPFYIGDTAGGLWLAYKATAVPPGGPGFVGHYVLGHASCLAKMVEGELVVDQARDGKTIPWDPDLYRGTKEGAQVLYKGRLFQEPARDRAWKLENLWHLDGRIVI